MKFNLNQCPLFAGMSEAEIEECLLVSQARIVSYPKDTYLFHQGELPRYMMVLLSGSTVIGNDSLGGKRNIVATFQEHGEMIGEVFLFLNKKEYDYFALADSTADVLLIPKAFFDVDAVNQNSFSYRLIANLLPVFAGKAYYLNQKIRIISGASLRQKIARMLLQHTHSDPDYTFSMNREKMADYLGVARPSLSRELSNMQAEGMISLEKRQIRIVDLSALQEII